MFALNEGHVMSDSIQTAYTGDEFSPSGTRPDAASARRNVVAVALGNAVEFFDFGTYATFAVMIGHTFFRRKARLSACCFRCPCSGSGSSCGRSARC
jgi:hypothetical protein